MIPEFDMWMPWAVDLTTEKGEVVTKLVIATPVIAGTYGKFYIRDGFTLEGPGMYGRIKYDSDRKVWTCIAFNKDRNKLPSW